MVLSKIIKCQDNDNNLHEVDKNKFRSFDWEQLVIWK